MSISQQTVAENAKAHTQLKLGFPILSDRGGRIAQLFGVRWCIPELLRDIHRKSGIDLPLLNGDESWTLPIPARFILDRAGLIAYSEIDPGQSAAPRRETSCPCWTTCAASALLEPRAAKHRGASTSIRGSNR